MKSKSGILFSLAFSGAAIFWLVHKLDYQSVMSVASRINYGIWFAVALIYVAGFLPRGLRWQLMLSTIKKVSFVDSLQIVILGYAANNILPFRLGELVRAYAMGKKNGVSKITCLGSIGAERIIDGIVLLFLLGVSFLSLSTGVQEDPAVQKLMLFGGIIFTTAMFLIMLLLLFSQPILNISERLLGNSIRSLLEKILHSVSFFRTRTILFKVTLLSFIVWLIEGSMFGLVLWDMGITNAVAAGYFCLGIVNLGILIPSAPGYVGIFQAASVLAFLALGYGKAEGLVYGLIVHVAQYLPITLIGIAVFINLGYRFDEFYKSIAKRA
jgi:hypothetical protein